MRVDRVLKTVTALVALAYVPLAQAHSGAVPGSGLAAGLAHPFTGLDHLLAMVAVGLWAAQHAGRARLALPLAFVAMMTTGAVLAMSGVLPAEPIFEAGVAASVLAVGLLVAARARLGLVTGVLLIGGFALLHGHVHGIELPAAASPDAYILGMMVSTATLHALGWSLGRYAQRAARELWLRGLGGGIAAAGALLWVGQF
ncbi:MAG TPA: HupE/UreJ family protein [Acidiferrobacterales bacterium]|jgi:urease accessory protein